MKKFLLALGIFVLCSNVSHALMPPHIKRVEGLEDGKLKGASLKVHGMTLGILDLNKDVGLFDAQGQSHALKIDRKCEWQGEGDQPGARQEKCELSIVFSDLKPGEHYAIKFKNIRDGVIEFIYQP